MTNEKGKDNTVLNPLTSPINPPHPIVPTLEGGVEHRRGPPSSLSLSPLVISSSISTLNGNGTVPPPRPPRSPKRRLADISENEVVEQTDLKGVIADFVKRLEAVPPPSSPDLESPDSIYSTSTVSSTSTTHKRIRSLPVIVEMLEVDRSRSASGGTFGGKLEMGMVQRASDDTEVVPHSDTLPATPLLPTSGGHSPISPLVLTQPPPGISASSGNDKATPPNMPLPLPSLHVTRPSTSSTMPEPGPEAFSAVVEMMDQGDSPGRRRARGVSPGPVEVIEEKDKYNQAPREGRAQIPRRGMMGPGAILAKVRSSQSLSAIRRQMSKPSIRAPGQAPSSQSNTSTGTTFLRPAPLPPPSSTYPARFAPTNYSRSNASSPSPSNLDGSLARATPDVRKSPVRGLVAAGEGEEMVEIPRFKRKELNLGLVRRRGPWQRIGWIVLWLTWLVNGLAGLFFDVNLMYMLVQCTTHSSNGQNPSRSWAFATAAYAICWGISIFVIWLGWEVYFEFWRKWRQTRPAIEPIYTSLPASLHLSLMSYTHFTFLVHVRLSSLSTPYRYDIIPETANALFQMLPGILPLLPRAGIGIVLLTTFSSPSTSRGDKDEKFFNSNGGLNAYAQGVILAFVSVVGFRFLIFLISAIILWLSTARPARAFFARPARQVETPTTPTKRTARSSRPPRDPSTTRSPQKTWYEAETSFGWDTWRSRMRARLQDAYELCMIRRSGTGIGSMVDGSYLVVAGRVTPSPGFNNSVRLGSRSVNDGGGGQGSVEELVEDGNVKARAISEGAVDEWLGTPKTGSTLMKTNQARPENPGPPSSNSNSTQNRTTPVQRPLLVPMRTTSNLSASGVYPSSQASHSSHDIFYTPASGTTPVVERKLPILGLGIQQPASQGIRNMLDPSRGTLPARPESDVMGNGNQELLSTNRMSQLSVGSDESITDDSAALLSASSRRDSEATTTTGDESGTSSRPDSISQDPGSRRSSVSRMVAAVGRSRAGSTASANHVMTRARSSSITLLRESAGAVQGVVRRARSGTVDGNAYNKIEGDDSPNTLPRRRSKLGLGPSMINDRAVSG